MTDNGLRSWVYFFWKQPWPQLLDEFLKLGSQDELRVKVAGILSEHLFCSGTQRQTEAGYVGYLSQLWPHQERASAISTVALIQPSQFVTVGVVPSVSDPTHVKDNTPV